MKFEKDDGIRSYVRLYLQWMMMMMMKEEEEEKIEKVRNRGEGNLMEMKEKRVRRYLFVSSFSKKGKRKKEKKSSVSILQGLSERVEKKPFHSIPSNS